MKAIWRHRRSFLVSILIFPLLSGCPAKESDADGINLEMMFLTQIFYGQCPITYSSADSINLSENRSQAATQQVLYRIPRTSISATTRVTLTINDPACGSFIRNFDYCDSFNIRQWTDAHVDCSSGKGAINGYITGAIGDQEICDISYPSGNFFLRVRTTNCQVSIYAEEI